MRWPAWAQRLRVAAPRHRLDEARWVVFDVETTGLDVRRDVVIAIGAVAVHGGGLMLADAFTEHLLQTQKSAPAAALAHRLTGAQLAQADPPDQVLARFVDYLAGAPHLAYHAHFDDSVLRRALKTARLSTRWAHSIDVAKWLLWLHPQLGPKPPTLDRALAFARIRQAGARRHQALTDAQLTAQLALWLLPETLRRGIDSIERLRKVVARAETLRQIRFAAAAD